LLLEACRLKLLPVAPPDQGTRRTMVLHTLLPCGSSLTYREMPEARCGRWCTLTDTIISRTNWRRCSSHRTCSLLAIGPANNDQSLCYGGDWRQVFSQRSGAP